MRIAFLASLLCVVHAVATAQSQAIAEKTYGNMISFPAGKQPEFVKGEVLLQEGDKIIPTREVLLKSVTGDPAGVQHFRYQQTINDIPVCGATYIVHVAGGHVLQEHGSFAALNLADQLSRQPVLRPGTAISLASQHINTGRQEASQQQDHAPTAELVYYSPYRDFEDLRLAYKTDIYTSVPLSHDFVYIDAITGEVLGTENRICTIRRMGNYTADSVDLTLPCTPSAPTCFLYEKNGGKEMETRSMNNTINAAAATRVNINSNTGIDRAAIDAHWAAERFYDYCYNKFGRNSINNNGMPLKSYVHYGNNYYNAMWDGYVVFYGDGDARNGYKPLTTLDICAHELTHGLVGYTAALNYYGESGALNEAFADIFASEVESDVQGDLPSSWTIGEKMGVTLRSMSDPNRYNQPAYYNGEQWENGTVDYGGVHINSGVLNYWYYLLVNGAKKLTDEYDSTNHKSPVAHYTFNGIGRSRAAKLVYTLLTGYLTENSRYYDAYVFSGKAADDLAFTAAEKVSMETAWTAVGIPRHIPSEDLCPSNVENDNSREMPRPLRQFVRAMIETSGDVDWYRFSAPNNKPNFKVVLDMESTKKNYNMRIYTANGNVLYKGNTKKKKIKSFTYNMNGNGGNYLVAVSGIKRAYNPNACYTLSVATSDRQLAPDDDDEDTTGDEDTEGNGLLPVENQDISGRIHVAPNPATDHLTLSFCNKDKISQNIVISDVSGRIIFRATSQSQKGPQQISIGLQAFKPGFYYVKLGTETIKFVVIK